MAMVGPAPTVQGMAMRPDAPSTGAEAGQW
jgi:hypothetical protein